MNTHKERIDEFINKFQENAALVGGFHKWANPQDFLRIALGKIFTEIESQAIEKRDAELRERFQEVYDKGMKEGHRVGYEFGYKDCEKDNNIYVPSNLEECQRRKVPKKGKEEQYPLYKRDSNGEITKVEGEETKI